MARTPGCSDTPRNEPLPIKKSLLFGPSGGASLRKYDRADRAYAPPDPSFTVKIPRRDLPVSAKTSVPLFPSLVVCSLGCRSGWGWDWVWVWDWVIVSRACVLSVCVCTPVPLFLFFRLLRTASTMRQVSSHSCSRCFNRDWGVTCPVTGYRVVV